MSEALTVRYHRVIGGNTCPNSAKPIGDTDTNCPNCGKGLVGG